MEEILLINKEKGRWSAKLEITKRGDEFGGLEIKVMDQFGQEAKKHIITIEAHHSEARELVQKLISILLA